MEHSAPGESACRAQERRQQQQQQQQQQEEETNCSETMATSSANSDEHEANGELVARRRRRQSSNIEQRRLASGRNRLGTPRRATKTSPDNNNANQDEAGAQQFATGRRQFALIDCETSASQAAAVVLEPFKQQHQAQQQQQQQCFGHQQPHASPTPPANAELASGADQLSSTTTMEFSLGLAPPSYGTAMRFCATLDARQMGANQTNTGVDYLASSTLSRPMRQMQNSQTPRWLGACTQAAASSSKEPQAGHLASDNNQWKLPINHVISVSESIHQNQNETTQQQWPSMAVSLQQNQTNQQAAAAPQQQQQRQLLHPPAQGVSNQAKHLDGGAPKTMVAVESSAGRFIATAATASASTSHRKRRRHRSSSGRRSSSPEPRALELQAARQIGNQVAVELPHASYSSAPRPKSGASISAHCWLIDSSDEAQAGSELGGGGGGCALRASSSHLEGHQSRLTVAMMRQDQARSRTLGRIGGRPRARANHLQAQKEKHEEEDDDECRSSASASAVAHRGTTEALTKSLKTNSLRLERILKRTSEEPPSCQLAGLQASSSRSTTYAVGGAGLRSSVSAASRLDRVRPSSAERHLRAPGPRAAAKSVVRLSSVLAFVSNLVSSAASSSSSTNRKGRRSRSACATPSYAGGTSSNCAPSSAPAYELAAQSISGSILSGPVALAAPPPHPYGPPSSFGVSSSSSTSAYATGATTSSLHSSHASNGFHKELAAGHLHQQRQPVGPMSLNSLKSLQGQAQLQQEQQLYSLQVRRTGPLSVAAGKHSYEYCDGSLPDSARPDLAKFTEREHAETQFGAPRNKSLLAASSCSPSSSDSGASSREAQSGAEDTANEARACLRLEPVHLLAAVNNFNSDHELLPPATSMSSGANQLQQLAAGSLPPAPRRRWLMNSFKLWLVRSLSRSPLAGNDSGSSLNGEECGQQSYPNGAPTQASGGLGGSTLSNGPSRYRSLPSVGAARRHCQPCSSQSSEDAADTRRSCTTLNHVISLAKADRVFRCRLLASVLVSLVLLLLIIMLIGTIYRQQQLAQQQQWQQRRALWWLTGGAENSKGATTNYGERQRAQRPSATHLLAIDRLNFMLASDDSDFDLSWLWSATTGAPNNVAPPSRGQQMDESAPDFMVGDTLLGGQISVAQQQQQQVDNEQVVGAKVKHQSDTNESRQPAGSESLKTLLEVIERSERLAQLQVSMTHLTNIQLANDQFVDLTRVAGKMLQPKANSSKATSGLPSDDSAPKISLSQSSLDVAYLNLLSNLHWPLVKWRHQSSHQQHASTASFFSLTHLLQSIQGGGGGQQAPPLAPEGSQTIRNLLSSLLLVELTADLRTLSEQPQQQLAANLNHLMQFKRLHEALSSISYHLLACSLVLDESPAMRGQISRRIVRALRENFCTLLVTRYKRMMLLLGELNHNQLVELYEQSEEHLEQLAGHLFSSSPPQSVSASGSKYSRNLLSFLLDRLAQLDVQLLAELVLSRFKTEEALSQAEILSDLETKRRDNALLELMLAEQQQAFNDQGKQHQQDDSQGKHLFDLIRELVGETPIESSIKFQLADDELQEFRRKFAQTHNERLEIWLEQLSRDLLDPLAGLQVSAFEQVRPLNYHLFLHPNLTTRLIMGMTKIEFELERHSSRFLVLNCAGLNVLEVSLWLRQQAGGGDQQQSMRRIPIRRIVQAHGSEQLLVELFEPIENGEIAAAATVSAKHDEFVTQFSRPKSALDFGEALPSTTMPQGSGNQFVLNISFNKTNLMETSSKAINDNGIQFVKYADYFVQQSSDDTEFKLMLVAQFDLGTASRARNLFPCFDTSPRQRAKFQLNLVHDHQHYALFNAPKRERLSYNSDGSHQMSVFEPTPIALNADQVAMVVYDSQSFKSSVSRLPLLQTSGVSSDFKRQESSNTLQVQVLVQLEHLNQAELLNQLVPQILSFYQIHLEPFYPMNKLDMIAVPRQVLLEGTRNAMETGRAAYHRQGVTIAPASSRQSLGLITFRVPQFLVDANMVSQDLLEQSSLELARRLARLYIGQILTIQAASSREHWLAEALCDYLARSALASVQPAWRLDEQSPVESIKRSLQEAEQQMLLAQAPPIEWAKHDQEEPQVLSGPQLDDWWLWPPEEVASNLVSQHDASVQSNSMHQNGVLNIEKEDQSVRQRMSAAVLHMLLFNLLPDEEARARLLRRCLTSFKYSTMSELQFWHQFSDQLQFEASPERLALEWSKWGPVGSPVEPERQNIATQADQMGDQNVTSSERVVFVRSRSRHTSSASQASKLWPAALDSRSIEPDVHQVSAPVWSGPQRAVRALGEPALPLDIIFSAWLEERHQGVPVVWASCYRDRLVVRQERYAINTNPPLILVTLDQQQPQQQLASGDKIGAERERARRSATAGELIWPIPLMYISRYHPKMAKFFWLYSRELELSFVASNSEQTFASESFSLMQKLPLQEQQKAARRLPAQYAWFKLNVNQSSLVRVNYDERNWEALSELLAKSHYSNHQLSSLDRANLLDDALALMRADKLSVSIAMNFTLYLEVGEREFAPWSAVLAHWDQMQTLLNQNPLWHRYVLRLLQPISTVIGWKDDGPHLMRKLRRKLFGLALQYGDEKIITKARQEFKQWLKNGRFIVPNLQELVYVAGLRYGADQADWLACWQKYQQLVLADLRATLLMAPNGTLVSAALANEASQSESSLADGRHTGSSERLVLGLMAKSALSGEQREQVDGTDADDEKLQLLSALASTQNTWLLEQFLNYTLDGDKIKQHHLRHVLQILGKNPVARLYLWRFVRLNWLTLQERYAISDCQAVEDCSGQEGIIEAMILESTKHFATKLDYDEVLTFFDTKYRQFLKSQPSEQAANEKSAHDWSASMQRAIKLSLQTIKTNIHWRDSIEPKLTRWLQQHVASM